MTENYINICANPQRSQKVVIDAVRPMWNRVVANFQEMGEEEKRKVPDVEEYAKMLYSIQIHQVMNKVRHLVALKREELLQEELSKIKDGATTRDGEPGTSSSTTV